MLNSLLLHLNTYDEDPATLPLIEKLLSTQRAKVRCLAITDTRQIQSLAQNGEAALYAAVEAEQLAAKTGRQKVLLEEFAARVTQSGIDFKVRCLRGNPLDLIPPDARFHDLLVTTWLGLVGREEKAKTRTICLTSLRRFAEQTGRPLLILPQTQQPIQRVILLYDGSLAAERAVKAYFHVHLWPTAELRLLATGRSEKEAKIHLQELKGYLHPLLTEFESGYVYGSARQSLVNYLDNWEADLVVLGISPRPRLFARLRPTAWERILRQTKKSLFVSA